jgi:tetratricopeptide (TPR) repeat protein
MSLVNDVLRQLDENSAKPYQTTPLHLWMTEQLVKKNKVLRITFILLVVVLFFILTLQVFYKKSLVDIFYFNDFKHIEVPQQSMWSTSVSENNRTGEYSNSNAKNIMTPERVLIIDDTSKIDAVKKDRFIQDVEVKDIKIKNANISNLETKIVTEKNNYQKANITAVKNIGFQHYQLSLRAYKNKRTSVALSRIDLALAAEKKDEYLRLKVRILMQKGNRAELYRFVLTQNDNESLSWFQLIAPSLQLYAYYDLSNKYYSKLIKAQPNDVKWWLAMALNYSKLEQNEKTYSIYKNLLNSSLLTDKQQRWIAKRLGRIEQGKVAINER